MTVIYGETALTRIARISANEIQFVLIRGIRVKSFSKPAPNPPIVRVGRASSRAGSSGAFGVDL